MHGKKYKHSLRISRFLTQGEWISNGVYICIYVSVCELHKQKSNKIQFKTNMLASAWANIETKSIE
jgi:hypothetical protein